MHDRVQSAIAGYTLEATRMISLSVGVKNEESGKEEENLWKLTRPRANICSAA
jgi:hypothetical protein